jgi:mono/diheme cytochrome c family protein
MEAITMLRIAYTTLALALWFLPGTASAQDAAKGKQVYTDNKCAVCHSVGNDGNKKGPLDGVASKVSEADLRAWITAAPEMAVKAKADRKPPMKSYTLAKEDLDALVAYMQTLKK